MLNVIIVDDETFILKSILNAIPWDTLGLNVVGTFSTGTEALDFITTHPVHLIITDIRMPGMSGLDLCDYVYNHFPEIQLIIISGYADFPYAQKAIKYNVLGYCIKPIDYTEVMGLLRKAIINTTKFHQSSYDIIDAFGNKDLDFLNTYLTNYNINTDHFYLMASIGITPLSHPLSSQFTTIKLGSHKYLYFSNQPFDVTHLTTQKLQTQNIKGVGIYTTCVSLDTLFSSVLQTISMAYQFFFPNQPTVCQTLPVCGYQPFLSRLKSVLTSRNLPEISAILEELRTIDNFASYSIPFALKIWNLFMVYRTDYSQLELEDHYIYNTDDLYQKFGCFEDMLSTLSEMITEQSTPIELPNTHNNTFIYILQFINHHYMKNISLADIASNFNLSQSYISQLFRKETSSTYTEYISQLRIQKAKELLLNNDLSLNDISEAIGYNDYFYFLKSFKKHVGISPGKYRAQGGYDSL
ncbi:MAG: response regulator transcription factor [Cellulosilyticaceae bacterium]